MNALILASSFTPGRALDARGDVDAARAGRRDRLGDIVGIEAPRQQPRRSGAKVARQRPVERAAVAAGQHGVRSAAWRRSAESPRRRRRARRRRSPAASPRRPLSWSSGRNAGGSRSPATAISRPCNCRISGESAPRSATSVSSSASTLSATIRARPRACAPSARACCIADIARAPLGKTRSPTMFAPAASAASRVAGVERPQILTMGVIAASFDQSAAACQRRWALARLYKRVVAFVSTPLRAPARSLMVLAASRGSRRHSQEQRREAFSARCDLNL